MKIQQLQLTSDLSLAYKSLECMVHYMGQYIVYTLNGFRLVFICSSEVLALVHGLSFSFF
jgi:hypothetical protein